MKFGYRKRKLPREEEEDEEERARRRRQKAASETKEDGATGNNVRGTGDRGLSPGTGVGGSRTGGGPSSVAVQMPHTATSGDSSGWRRHKSGGGDEDNQRRRRGGLLETPSSPEHRSRERGRRANSEVGSTNHRANDGQPPFQRGNSGQR